MKELYNRSSELVYYDVTNYYFEIDDQDEFGKRGVSKEHRKDPIIQMGLFTDSAGIPISYRLFPGNTNDCETLIPLVADMKKEYGIKHTIVVADKGPNTSDNIAFNIIACIDDSNLQKPTRAFYLLVSVTALAKLHEGNRNIDTSNQQICSVDI
ncbi:MAG: transposase [Acidimicrobiales bacterium]|nr:transposase [Acidimicrobiales bacterium]